MIKKVIVCGAAVGMTASALAGLYGDTPDAKHAWAVHDMNRPKPAKVEPSKTLGGAPSDAIVLFDGTKESFLANWVMTKDKTPPTWEVRDGAFRTKASWGNGTVQTKREFGDCQLHIEYRHDPTLLFSNKGAQMRGNSGVFLMGTAYGYEVQVLESYSTSRDLAGKPGFIDNYTDGQAGSVYAENPPLVNPARPAGEWQVYDIIFHQPVWEGETLVHPGSVTVLFNGVVVQDAWEMEGQTTHCRRRPLKPHPTTGPLALQDHGCEVEYRNIWIRPLASRWDNKTHSSMSADPAQVMALRRATAAKLFAKIRDPKAATPANIAALGEVISYANESPYAEAFNAALEAFRAGSPDKAAAESVNRTLDILIRNNVIPVDRKISIK